jgi:hypothetical protein
MTSNFAWALFLIFNGFFGSRESIKLQQHEIDGVFNRFCLESASFLLDSTMEAFLERAALIKAEIEKKVGEINASIISLEQEATELLWRPGDEVERELNRREASSRSNCAGGSKFQRSQVLYGEFKQRLGRLQRSMRADENRFVAEQGMLICQSYSLGNGHGLARKVVLWPDGRHFLITYTLVKVDGEMEESKLYELLYQQPVQWATDSLYQFSKAELVALENFNRGFVAPATAAA